MPSRVAAGPTANYYGAMNSREVSLAVAVGVVTLLSVRTAQAETISVGARLGYGVATGDTVKGSPLKDSASGVIPLQIDALYYLGLGFSVGAYGSYGILTGLSDTAESGTQTRLGAQAQFVLPLPLLKPWVGAGIGYEWQGRKAKLNGTTTDVSASGLELFNIAAGVKFTALPILSVGPYVQYQRATFTSTEALGAKVDIPDANQAAHGYIQGGLRAELSF